jgi:hypothetical protein
MSSSHHSEYLVEHTHSYWFYSRGSSISTEFMIPLDRKMLWDAIESQDKTSIDQELENLPYFFSRVFDAIHTHSIFQWSEVKFQVSSIIPEGHELTHDIVNGQQRRFSVTRRGFWAASADGRHQIMFMFCWRPGDEPRPRSIQIRYIGPQGFRTFDNNMGRLMQEKMQGPHSR